MAPVGQSGTQRPHSSQRLGSTIATWRDAGRAIARDVIDMCRLCQANALLAHTRTATLRPDVLLCDPSVPPGTPEPLLDALALLESGKILFPGERHCGRPRYGEHADLRQGRRH